MSDDEVDNSYLNVVQQNTQPQPSGGRGQPPPLLTPGTPVQGPMGQSQPPPLVLGTPIPAPMGQTQQPSVATPFGMGWGQFQPPAPGMATSTPVNQYQAPTSTFAPPQRIPTTEAPFSQMFTKAQIQEMSKQGRKQPHATPRRAVRQRPTVGGPNQPVFVQELAQPRPEDDNNDSRFHTPTPQSAERLRSEFMRTARDKDRPGPTNQLFSSAFLAWDVHGPNPIPVPDLHDDQAPTAHMFLNRDVIRPGIHFVEARGNVKNLSPTEMAQLAAALQTRKQAARQAVTEVGAKVGPVNLVMHQDELYYEAVLDYEHANAEFTRVNDSGATNAPDIPPRRQRRQEDQAGGLPPAEEDEADPSAAGRNISTGYMNITNDHAPNISSFRANPTANPTADLDRIAAATRNAAYTKEDIRDMAALTASGDMYMRMPDEVQIYVHNGQIPRESLMQFYNHFHCAMYKFNLLKSVVTYRFMTACNAAVADVLMEYNRIIADSLLAYSGFTAAIGHGRVSEPLKHNTAVAICLLRNDITTAIALIKAYRPAMYRKR